MSQFWFDHLSATLKDNNIVAYMWNVGEDRFQWAGDLYGFLGMESGDYPATKAAFHQIINPQDVPERLSALHDVLDSDSGKNATSSFTATYKIRRANGSFIEVEEIATLQSDIASGQRQLCGFLKFSNSGQGQVVAAENVVPVNGHDGGFGNYGRNALQRKITEWFDTYDPAQRSYGYVLAIGIDRMALFNDVMGPRYADEILEKTGARLRQVVGESGAALRIDGDVYGIFFKQAPHNEMAAVAQYILNNFYNIPLQTSMGPVGVSISIGGVLLDRSKDVHSFVTMAEMAMNVAKDKGRSCFVSYDEAAHKAEDNRTLLKSADTFLKALKGDRLRFAFQPVMGSKNNSVSFHECLIRLIDENGTLIPAGNFIPAIEEMGLSRLVDQHALRMAIQELSMFPDLSLSVNVSNLSLNNQDWLRNLVGALNFISCRKA